MSITTDLATLTRGRLIEQIDIQIADAEAVLRALRAARAVLADGPTEEAADNGSPKTATAVARKRPDHAGEILALIAARAGITAAEINRAGISTNAYRIIKKLHAGGAIEPCEQGWKVRA